MLYLCQWRRCAGDEESIATLTKDEYMLSSMTHQNLSYLVCKRSYNRVWAAEVTYFALDDRSRDAVAGQEVRICVRHLYDSSNAKALLLLKRGKQKLLKVCLRQRAIGHRLNRSEEEDVEAPPLIGLYPLDTRTED